MIPAISQVCTLHSPFEKDIEDFASAGCSVIELWLGKLESYLGRHSIQDARSLLEAHNVSAPVISFQGGLFVQQSDAREEHWRQFRERLVLCENLGVKTLIVAGDVPPLKSDEDIQKLKMLLGAAAESATQHGCKLAFEFQARAGFANNLQTAVFLIAEIGAANLGICLDICHYFLGTSKSEDLDLLSTDNLFHVQFSDIAGIPRELANDSDRVIPGDGEFQLQPIVDYLRRINYKGCVSLELLNPRIWQIPPLQVGEIGMTAMRKVLRLAAME